MFFPNNPMFQSRFILTMRNVNLTIKLQISKRLKFYINYEECKCYRNWNYNITSICFILTMRNVNPT